METHGSGGNLSYIVSQSAKLRFDSTHLVSRVYDVTEHAMKHRNSKKLNCR